jgi:hypothetical protein
MGDRKQSIFPSISLNARPGSEATFIAVNVRRDAGFAVGA